MSNPNHRDDPPIFFISPQVAGYRYHALLTEPVAVPTNLTYEVYDADRGKRIIDGETVTMLTRGIYGFQHVELRDKFCRRCNAIAEAIETKIAFPVTIPMLYMDEPMVTSIRYQPATAPVAPTEG